ncbi:MAG: hypothetical protein FWF52_01125 [Candidatus Azobacteroides sp.]|nr:hypothetical protein [Candidatus Azobacteroides sp.]
MKTRLLIIFVCLFCVSGCRTVKQYVPVPEKHTEYIDKILRDSIYVQDSVFFTVKGDTIWLEKVRTVYKEKLKVDSVYLMDTIPVIQEVIVEKPVNFITGWQNFQMWCGRILFGACSLSLLYWIIKRKW